MVPKGQIHQRCTALLRCTPHTQWDNAACLICANHVHCLYSNCRTDRPPPGLTCSSLSTVHATHSLRGGGCPFNTMGHHRGSLLCHSMLHTDVHQHLKQGRVLDQFTWHGPVRRSRSTTDCKLKRRKTCAALDENCLCIDRL